MKPAVKIAIVVALLLVVAVLVYQQSQSEASAAPADDTAGSGAIDWLTNGKENTTSIRWGNKNPTPADRAKALIALLKR